MPASPYRRTRESALFACALVALILASTQPLASHNHLWAQARHRPIAWRHVRLLVTAYVIRPDRGCTTNLGRTARNTRARFGIVAADPRLFAYGSTFIVPGYGRARMEDRGGAIVGRHIDIAVDSCHEALNWGTRHEVVAVQPPVHL